MSEIFDFLKRTGTSAEKSLQDPEPAIEDPLMKQETSTAKESAALARTASLSDPVEAEIEVGLVELEQLFQQCLQFLVLLTHQVSCPLFLVGAIAPPTRPTNG